MDKILIFEDKLTLRSPEGRDKETMRKLLNDPEIESTTMGSHFPITRRQQDIWFEYIYPQENTIRAIPHNSKCSYTQSAFSSDETKSAANTVCIGEHFCEIWR